MRTKLLYIVVTFIALCTAALICMVVFSPYGKDASGRKLLKRSIQIEASAESVFNYLGNSNHASDWSVFVKKITPLNADQVSDGHINSERRCFTQNNQLGMIWDERIIEVVPLKKRKLQCYNFQNFSLTAGNLVTEQLYEKIDSNHSRLSFTLFLSKEDSSFLSELKFYYAGYTIAQIFEENLKNIAQQVE